MLYYPQLSSISSYQLYVEVRMYGYYDLKNIFHGSVMEFDHTLNSIGSLRRVGLVAFLSRKHWHPRTVAWP